MKDFRRTQLPWYLQRWHFRYAVPAVMFWTMAGLALGGFRISPVVSVMATLFFAVIAGVFTRIVWQERFPLRSKSNRSGKALNRRAE